MIQNSEHSACKYEFAPQKCLSVNSIRSGQKETRVSEEF